MEHENPLPFNNGEEVVITAYGEYTQSYYGDTIDGVFVEINGKKFYFFIDPDDGYRSYACVGTRAYEEDIEIGCETHFVPQKVVYNFHSIQEEACYDEDNYHDYIDAWVLTLTSKYGEVLRVGTDYSDTYYPVGTCSWHPENLPINN